MGFSPDCGPPVLAISLLVRRARLTGQAVAIKGSNRAIAILGCECLDRTDRSRLR
ncbi:MAG: hypothetical protein HC838_15250 [Spirulinaceae cyanobacterium RM2_2_10]|nr:hypothetical protein [Spirulinaceae cyanobacterium SM2_1_0]NJO21117.1 hypothetical protein [Spirulinaceae cyanobacterium RM2_2_10]